MIPEQDLMDGSTYSSGHDAVTEEDAMGRLYLINSDIEKAKSYLSRKEERLVVNPFDYFSNGYLITNLLFTSAHIRLAEKSKISAHFGDKFALHYFGKSPLIIQVVGFLLNPHDDSHKAGLVSAYRYLLRLGIVARMGIAPYISFLKYTAKGAMLNLKMSESSALEGVIQVNFDWMVFELYTTNVGSSDLTDTGLADTKPTDAYIGYC